MKHQTQRTALVLGLLSATLSPIALAAKPAPATSTEKQLSQSFESITSTLNQAKQQVSKAITERDHALTAVKQSQKLILDRDKEIAELKKQLTATLKTSKDWETKALASQKSAIAWEKKAVTVEKVCAEWKKKAETHEKTLAIGNAAQKKMAEFHSRLEKTMTEFGALESELGKLRGEMKEPREKAALLADCRKAKAENEQMKKQITQLSSAYEQSKKTATAMTDDLKKKLATLSDGYAKSQRSAVNTTAELNKVKREFAQLEETHKRFKDSAEKMAKITSEKEQAALKRAVTAAKTAEEAASAMKAKVEALKKELTKTETVATKMEQKNKSLESTISQHEKQVQSLKKQLDQKLQAKRDQKSRPDNQAPAPETVPETGS